MNAHINFGVEIRGDDKGKVFSSFLLPDVGRGGGFEANSSNSLLEAIKSGKDNLSQLRDCPSGTQVVVSSGPTYWVDQRRKMEPQVLESIVAALSIRYKHLIFEIGPGDNFDLCPR
ncbi:MAG: hypothetical protein UT36_C0008G0024 [Candidatus Peregrinibacteria bacterium GW2011_GWF2_39_17]|nr:MAG: hypothetical protein UT36_C0008G0024 [Candidatus Peregrinibacteria bacterium GW2011_GWF2_39_17]HCW32062.1 hypothetical protein [Candidatus Peregrinibacteria bacterium]